MTDVATAMETAVRLLDVGVPLFVAQPDETQPTGFRLPRGWQNTTVDKGVLNRWRPGDALCAVMGRGLDLLDVDPRHGGDHTALGEELPRIHGFATTPSGGYHLFVASMDVRSLDGKLSPGIDVKAGIDGQGHGFAFIPPTVRKSKVTGEPTPYQWVLPPNEEGLRGLGYDCSGQALGERIRELHGSSVSRGPESFFAMGPWSDIKATLEGGRNNGIHQLAAALRGRGGWRLGDALSYMRETVWPLIDQGAGGHEFSMDEFETAITGAWERYEDGAEARLNEASDTSSERTPLAGEGLTESYMADRAAAQCFAGQYCWVRAMGWLRWTGKKWSEVDQSVVKNGVREWMIYLYEREAAAGVEPEQLKPLRAYLSRAKITAIVDLCQGHPLVQAEATDFDQDPDVLHVQNGVVDLRTGQMHGHDPARLNMKLADTEYHPDARSDVWDQALSALPDDARDWYHVRMGQAITGHPPTEDTLLLQLGGGSNGKGTISKAFKSALGGYFVLISDRALFASESAHPTEKMGFFGARMALMEETQEGGLLPTTTLKRIIGTQMITARRINRDPITFDVSHTMAISTNYPPVIADNDHATWRRLIRLDFPYRFVPSEDKVEHPNDRVGNPGLNSHVTQAITRKAVLAWLVAGAVRWYANGKQELPVTEGMRRATEEWREQSDPIAQFVTERMELSNRHHVIGREAYEEFCHWQEEQGGKGWGSKTFTQRLLNHPVIGRKVEAVRPWPGKQAGTELSRRPANGVFPTANPAARYRAFDGLKFLSEVGREDDVTQREGDTTPLPERDLARGQENSVTAGQSVSGQNGQEETSIPESLLNRESTPIYDSSIDDSKSPLRPEVSKEPKPNKAHKPVKRGFVEVPTYGGEEFFDLPAVIDRSGSVVGCSTSQAVEHVRAAMLRSEGRLTMDVETSGYPLGFDDYRLKTVQLGDSELAVVFDSSDDGQAVAIAKLLYEADVLVAHSMQADIIPLVDAGLIGWDEAWDKADDTVLRAKLTDPALTGSDPSLKQIAKTMLGSDAVSPKAEQAKNELFARMKWLVNPEDDTAPERNGWHQVDPRCKTMIVYAASDVLDTAYLDGLLHWPSDAVRDRERLTQRMCARVALDGLPLREEQLRERIEHHEREKAARETEAREHYGIIKLGSSKEKIAAFESRGVVLPRTDPTTKFPNGQPSIKDAVLIKLSSREDEVGDLARHIQDYQGHKTALGLQLLPNLLRIARGDGRVRSTVYTLGTNTGRMSSVRRNLQQISKEGGIRPTIGADPGYALINADFSGVEIRVAAALSQDPTLMAFLAEGRDLHEEIARQVWGDSYTKMRRYQAKGAVFGRLYGAGIQTVADQVGLEVGMAHAVIDVLDDLTPRLKAWGNELKGMVKQGMTHFPTPAGRIIHLPKEFPHKVVNYAVQGTARELTVDAMVKWYATKWGDCLIVPVHDELDVMVPEDEAEEASRVLVECMTSEIGGVKIVAEAKTPSTYWKDASES